MVCAFNTCLYNYVHTLLECVYVGVSILLTLHCTNAHLSHPHTCTHTHNTTGLLIFRPVLHNSYGRVTLGAVAMATICGWWTDLAHTHCSSLQHTHTTQKKHQIHKILFSPPTPWGTTDDQDVRSAADHTGIVPQSGRGVEQAGAADDVHAGGARQTDGETPRKPGKVRVCDGVRV